ncbi:hypothetical protein AB0M48_38635 [Lentzea sp. NPDC051208]|uniref:hypothetical protein n=1 Tax=Lentzea sp. NPDC051208 TaxID=3154642 RepID=UPI00341E44F2
MTQPLALSGLEVAQGNLNGNYLTGNEWSTVLWTSDLGPCVAICGYNGDTAFLIHSDSTRASGIGATDLASGLQALIPGIGVDSGYALTLIGGSTAGTAAYLREHLAEAEIVDGGWADSAYITGDGRVAPTKRKLAEALGAESITIV